MVCLQPHLHRDPSVGASSDRRVADRWLDRQVDLAPGGSHCSISAGLGAHPSLSSKKRHLTCGKSHVPFLYLRPVRSTRVGKYPRQVSAEVGALAWVVSQRLLHPASCHLVMAVEALCIDLEQHLDGVTRPLGYLRCRYSPVEPGGHTCVP
jgi:hypothetical protein